MTTLGSYEVNQVYNVDALALLQGLPEACIHCIVTSPPYFGLRDYGVEGQLGLEETTEAFVEALVQVFREAWRVLRNDGTLWLNLGDSYNSAAWGNSKTNFADPKRGKRSAEYAGEIQTRHRTVKTDQLKAKDLLMMPARVALALQADGWYLRSDIIWAKPNPMPESVTDRPTKSHEHLFLLAKNSTYYYDAEAIEETAAYDGRRDTVAKGSAKYEGGAVPGQTPQSFASGRHERWRMNNGIRVRNKRDVWTIPTQPYPGAHFAVFPEALVKPCILAGCPEGGIVLDCFMGSGTVARVAHRLGRQYLGSEINPVYVEMANASLGQMSLYEALP